MDNVGKGVQYLWAFLCTCMFEAVIFVHNLHILNLVNYFWNFRLPNDVQVQGIILDVKLWKWIFYLCSLVFEDILQVTKFMWFCCKQHVDHLTINEKIGYLPLGWMTNGAYSLTCFNINRSAHLEVYLRSKLCSVTTKHFYYILNTDTGTH